MEMPLVQIHGVDDVRIDTVEKPTVGSGDILVRVSLCGICGSDLSYISLGGLGLTQPMPLGHELTGTVEELGEGVTGLKVGDRVVVNPMANANSIGNGGSEGAFAPYLLVRNVVQGNDAVLKVPDELSPEQAAMVEPLSVALHGCHQGGAQAADSAVIFGAGPIGLCVALCLKHIGLKSVVVVDLSEYRLKMAERIGAIPFQAGSGDLAQFLLEQHGAGEVMGMPAPGTDIFFEATGAAPVFEQIVNTARTGARVVVLGVHKAPVQMDLTNLLMRELKITGSMAYPDEFPEVIAMLRSGTVDVTPLISHRFPLSEFDTALARAKDGAGAIKVMIDCQQ